MKKLKIEIEIEGNQESKVSVEVLSGYVLRAIAGVAAANKAVIASYRCVERRDDSEVMDKGE